MRFEAKVIPQTEDGRTDVIVLRVAQELASGDAYIEWEPTGELYYVKVPEQHRRQGIATGLWHAANNAEKIRGLPPLQHSQYRTKDGDAWATSLGTPLPTLIKA